MVWDWLWRLRTNTASFKRPPLCCASTMKYFAHFKSMPLGFRRCCLCNSQLNDILKNRRSTYHHRWYFQKKGMYLCLVQARDRCSKHPYTDYWRHFQNSEATTSEKCVGNGILLNAGGLFHAVELYRYRNKSIFLLLKSKFQGLKCRKKKSWTLLFGGGGGGGRGAGPPRRFLFFSLP